MTKASKRENKSERLHMLISPSELQAIDDWRFANRVGTRAQAVRRLVSAGLELERINAELKKIEAEHTEVAGQKAIALAAGLKAFLAKIPAEILEKAFEGEDR